MIDSDSDKTLQGGGSAKKRPYVTAGLWKGAVTFSMAALLAAQPVVAIAAPVAAQAQEESAQQGQPAQDADTPKADDKVEGAVEEKTDEKTAEPTAEQEPAPQEKAATAAAVEQTEATDVTATTQNDVDNVEENGTLTLKGTVTGVLNIKKSMTIKAENGAKVTGKLKIAAANVTVDGVHFELNEDSAKRNVADSIEINNGVGPTVIKNCTFTTPSAESSMSQPNGIRVTHSSNVTFEENTFNLGAMLVKKSDGTTSTTTNVGINLVGGAGSSTVKNIVVKNNHMTVTGRAQGLENIGTSGVVLLIANGNADGKYGVQNVTLTGNTFDGDADKANARFAGFNDANGVTVNSNTIKNAAFGVHQTSWKDQAGTTHKTPFVFSEMKDNTFENVGATSGAIVVTSAEGKTSYFGTMTDALAKADKGATLTLQNNLTENVVIPKGVEVTLDLNGHTLSGGTTPKKAALTNNGTVVIKDSSGNDSGCIIREDNGASGYYTINNQGTMTIKSGSVHNQTGPMPAGSSLICNADGQTPATLNIEGGYIRQDGFIAVKNGDHGILNVTGGTIETTGDKVEGDKSYSASAVQNWCTANITGGVIKGAVWTSTWSKDFPASKTVIDGTATVTGKIIVKQDDNHITGVVPELEIKGGTLNVTGWGVATGNQAGKTSIFGGTFTGDNAEKAKDYLAGGFELSTDGSVKPAEKTVATVDGTAYESLGAAIGAAKDGSTVTLYKASSENVTVKNKITVTAASKDFAYTGTMTLKPDASNSTIENMSLELVKADNSISRSIVLDGAKDVTIRNNKFAIKHFFTGITPASIWMNAGSDNATITGNAFTGCDGSAINMQPGSSEISNTTVSNNSLRFIKKDQSDEIGHANFLVAFGHKDVASTNDYSIKGLTIINNDLELESGYVGTSGAIGFNSATDVVLSGNKFKNWTVALYALTWSGATPQPSSKVAVKGNSFVNIDKLTSFSPVADKMSDDAIVFGTTGDDANSVAKDTYSAVAPTVENANLAFAGWYSDADFKTPAKQGDMNVHAKYVPISDVIQFQGGSLKMNGYQTSDGKTDYSKTDLRFGYHLVMPTGATRTAWF